MAPPAASSTRPGCRIVSSPSGCETVEQAAHAIRAMQVRGAPLIGAAAAYAMWLAMRADASDEALERAYALLLATRPTAINLKWALDEMVAVLRNRPRGERAAAALDARHRDRRRGRRHQSGDRPARLAVDRGHRRAQEEPASASTC